MRQKLYAAESCRTTIQTQVRKEKNVLPSSMLSWNYRRSEGMAAMVTELFMRSTVEMVERCFDS